MFTRLLHRSGKLKGEMVRDAIFCLLTAERISNVRQPNINEELSLSGGWRGSRDVPKAKGTYFVLFLLGLPDGFILVSPARSWCGKRNTWLARTSQSRRGISSRCGASFSMYVNEKAFGEVCAQLRREELACGRDPHRTGRRIGLGSHRASHS